MKYSEFKSKLEEKEFKISDNGHIYTRKVFYGNGDDTLYVLTKENGKYVSAFPVMQSFVNLPDWAQNFLDKITSEFINSQNAFKASIIINNGGKIETSDIGIVEMKHFKEALLGEDQFVFLNDNNDKEIAIKRDSIKYAIFKPQVEESHD